MAYHVKTYAAHGGYSEMQILTLGQRNTGRVGATTIAMKNNLPTPTVTPPPQTSEKRRVFLVDDHPITRQGLAALINSEHNLVVCGETDNAPAAIELIQKLAPDIALVDVTLKTTSGIELMKHLKALRPEMPVLIMSMHDESLFAERALRAGAKGYIMKLEPSAQASLRRFAHTLGGDLYLSEKMKDKMLHRLLERATGRSHVCHRLR